DVTGRANLAGAGLNLARRVMDCGDAGHILLSKHLAEDLTEFEEWRPLLHDLGTCEVKHGVQVAIINLWSDDVGNPQLPQKFQALRKHRARVRWAEVATALLLVAGIATAFVLISKKSARSRSIVPEKSIAVLPFANRSEEKDNAYFADGIQDEILARLSKIADVKVISRTSTQRYKSAPNNLREIAQQLGVANILEGNVQKAADQVRITVQLINAANDSHLWAETYDRKLIDVFQVESDVAQKIAAALEAKLTGREKNDISSVGTKNSQAYDAYLRALAVYREYDYDSLQRASQALEQAVGLDPDFAAAWALLAKIQALTYFEGYDKTEASRVAARKASETALRLQPELAEAQMAKGFY